MAMVATVTDGQAIDFDEMHSGVPKLRRYLHSQTCKYARLFGCCKCKGELPKVELMKVVTFMAIYTPTWYSRKLP